MIYEALSVPDNMGISQYTHSNHCGFPAIQQPEVDAYVATWMLGKQGLNTTVAKTDGGYEFDRTKWTPWPVPKLT